MLDRKLAPFAGQKYMALETFKKNGEGVKTPVWFVLHNDAFYFYTEADSWKVNVLTRINRHKRTMIKIKPA